jgi:hypothetical protein
LIDTELPMIRNLIVFIVFVVALGFAGLYAAYNQIDPCRALAVEQSRRSHVATSVAEVWARMQTSQMSEGRCARDLFHSWRERAVSGDW